MKKITATAIAVYAFLVITACVTNKGQTVNTVPLDQAIQEASKDIEDNVQAGQKIAVLNFTSPTEQFSEYVLYQLSEKLVNGRKLTVVDRTELDLIRQEEQFQLSGEVSDESAQAIGKKLGAQLIVSGSINAIGNVYHFRIRTLAVETAAVETSYSADVNPRETRVASLLGGAKPATVQTTQSSQTYKIGDTGPAGGIIFYDKGFFSDDWQYLEAAPAKTEFRAKWGGYSKYAYVSGTSTDIGTGRQNTRLIADYLRAEGEKGRAAQRCAMLNVGGFTDWFLPSIDELALMYKNLKQKGLGDFGNSWYWSSSSTSSQYNNNLAWGLYFTLGSDGKYGRNVTLSVRAVRAF